MGDLVMSDPQHFVIQALDLIYNAPRYCSEEITERAHLLKNTFAALTHLNPKGKGEFCAFVRDASSLTPTVIIGTRFFQNLQTIQPSSADHEKIIQVVPSLWQRIEEHFPQVKHEDAEACQVRNWLSGLGSSTITQAQMQEKSLQPERISEPPILTDFAQLSLPEIIATPQYRQLLEALRSVDKLELHAHLGGAVSFDFVRKYATEQTYGELRGFIERLRNQIDYKEVFKVFPLIGQVLNSNQRIEEAAYDFCESQYKDKVSYSELRTSLKRLDGDFEDYLRALIRGLRRGWKSYRVYVNIILSVRRDTPRQDAEETVDLALQYRHDGVCGLDVSGESTVSDSREIVEVLQRARREALPIVLHIGESPLEKPEQQLRELEALQPVRVGHAVHLSPKARHWIENRRINGRRVVIEACITSALSTGMIKTPGDHPALRLFREGHPVIFCSDDSTLFGSLSEELALTACLCNLSVDAIRELQENTLLYTLNPLGE